jgi:L-ribulose-5-phosphate 4-epimerase
MAGNLGVAGTMGEGSSEEHLRQQVAACTLMLNELGILGYSGHVSARLPEGRFLVQSFDQSRAELTPEKLLVCDLDGRMLSGPSGQRPPAEVALHCEIFRARDDVNSIAHFHYDRATVFTLAEGVRLVPVKNHAIRWASGIAVHDDPSHVNTAARGRSLAATLGVHHAVMIRAHGQVIAAETIPALFIDCVHFVENAEAMYAAALLGPVRALTDAEMTSFALDLKRDKHVSKLWTYYTGRARMRGLLQDWPV